tara:strand:- start:41 stop:547 length:507 start_codon:yes stop_codon:yes gene_type:complete
MIKMPILKKGHKTIVNYKTYAIHYDCSGCARSVSFPESALFEGDGGRNILGYLSRPDCINGVGEGPIGEARDPPGEEGGVGSFFREFVCSEIRRGCQDFSEGSGREASNSEERFYGDGHFHLLFYFAEIEDIDQGGGCGAGDGPGEGGALRFIGLIRGEGDRIVKKRR